uniref:Discoidin domain-containing protein n=1 Tax=Onchocerca volvulus TaxID=6282 RepID=A0A8R1TSP3_ONCVO
GSIEIIFEFADIRKFAYFEIWTYGTSLRTIEIFFSINSKKFTLASQISSIQRRASDAARNLPIRIPLHNAIGQALKMKLSYREQWLFLSEIYFASSTVRKATVSTRILTTITDITTTATIITSSIPGMFNSTSPTTVDESIGIFPVIYFIGEYLGFKILYWKFS